MDNAGGVHLLPDNNQFEAQGVFLQQPAYNDAPQPEAYPAEQTLQQDVTGLQQDPIAHDDTTVIDILQGTPDDIQDSGLNTENGNNNEAEIVTPPPQVMHDVNNVDPLAANDAVDINITS